MAVTTVPFRRRPNPYSAFPIGTDPATVQPATGQFAQVHTGYAPTPAPLTDAQIAAEIAKDPRVLAVNRGSADALQDLQIGDTRGLAHYLLDKSTIETNRDLGIADLDAQTKERLADYRNQLSTTLSDLQKRSLWGREDINRESGRQQSDLGQQLLDLSRSYGNLALGQTGAIRQAQPGGGSGALLQAKAARAGNEAHDRAPIDLALGRSREDQGRDLSRLDYEVNTGTANAQSNFEKSLAAAQGTYDAGKTRLQREADLDLAKLFQTDAPPPRNPDGTLNYALGGESWVDRYLGYSRTDREAQQYPIDLAASEGENFAGPQTASPANEFRTAGGQSYRVIIDGNDAVGIDPSGRELWRRPRAAH